MPTGDTLAGPVQDVEGFDAQAKVILSAGMAVYISAALQVLKASASADATATVIGAGKRRCGTGRHGHDPHRRGLFFGGLDAGCWDGDTDGRCRLFSVRDGRSTDDHATCDWVGGANRQGGLYNEIATYN